MPACWLGTQPMSIACSKGEEKGPPPFLPLPMGSLTHGSFTHQLCEAISTPGEALDPKETMRGHEPAWKSCSSGESQARKQTFPRIGPKRPQKKPVGRSRQPVWEGSLELGLTWSGGISTGGQEEGPAGGQTVPVTGEGQGGAGSHSSRGGRTWSRERWRPEEGPE